MKIFKNYKKDIMESTPHVAVMERKQYDALLIEFDEKYNAMELGISTSFIFKTYL